LNLWLIVDVDVEFDALRFNRMEASKNNPGLERGLPILLEFFHRYGIRATFHMQEQANPELSIIERYPKLYDMIDNYGQEVSLHVHIKDESYEKRKKEIKAGYNRLKEAGYNIESFRAGWYFTNENTIKVLEELRIKFDVSPLKGITIGNKKFYNIPDSPYHPSYNDITKLGNANVLVIPVTDIRLGIGIHKENKYEYMLIEKGIDILASKAQEIKEPMIIYFTTHSWKPLTPKGKLREWERKRREHFIKCLSKYEYQSLTVSEAGKLWEKNNYQPYFLDLPYNALKVYPWYNFRRYDFLNRYVLSNLHIMRYKLFGKL